MASVRQFPTIKAVRSFVIGGVGSGRIAHLREPAGHQELTAMTSQVVTITTWKEATGKEFPLPKST